MKKLLLIAGMVLTLNMLYGNDEPLSNQPWTNFGVLGKAYNLGRKGYSEEAYNIIKAYIPLDGKVMDLGCGTGIATRQLRKNGWTNVVGVDRDPLMLEHALAANTESMTIPYLQGDVSKGLNFPAGEFDAVTAFSAFHWFSNPSSCREVARILKPQGYYIAVGVTKDLVNNPKRRPRTEITKMIEKASGKTKNGADLDYARQLEEGGFKVISKDLLEYTDTFTKEQYLQYVQSYSSWHLVKDSPQVPELLEQISRYLDSIADENGLIKEINMIQVVVAQKP